MATLLCLHIVYACVHATKKKKKKKIDLGATETIRHEKPKMVFTVKVDRLLV